MSTPAIRLITLTTPGPAAQFGLAELTAALLARGLRLDAPALAAAAEIVVGRVDDAVVADHRLGLPAPAPEAYAISRPSPTVLGIVGHDEVGLMYGCLDLAEQLAMGVELAAIVERAAAPELAVRGLSTFLHHPAAERDWLHDPTFWRHYADALARWRYNRFTLVYGHQSSYLTPIYTYLLDDLDTEFPDIHAADATPATRAQHLSALQMASAAMADRGIRFFLGIWNSRPWKMENGVWETQPTRVAGTDDLARLAAYTRAGFQRLIERCPAIAGIQLRMNIESGVADQRFFVQAYAPVLAELARHERRLTVELRNWGLQPETIEAFRAAGVDLVVSTKYFAEHQALPYQPPAWRGSYSYDSVLRRDKPFPFQWHLWNLGSHRLFAWGDPDYARRFAHSCHLGDGIGFEVTPPGSQQGFSQWGLVEDGAWSPRRDLPPAPVFERYWFFHQAFGRLGYDSATGDEVFQHQLARRTSPAAAAPLLAVYRAASQVVSYLISKTMDDPNMYVWPELDCGGPIDHHTLAPPGEATLFATAREYAAAWLAGRGSAKRSPLDAAHDLEAMADAIEAALTPLAGVAATEDLAVNYELQFVRVDGAALAALARYHAAKSRAAGHLALFYAAGEQADLDAAERAAEAGVELWEELCRRTAVYHDRLHLGPSGGHWRDNRPRVAYDLARIRRVRALFAAHGLFDRGFDFGLSLPTRTPPRWVSGLEPEPRFVGVDAQAGYTTGGGHGWLQPAGLRAEGYDPLPRDLIWGVHYIRPGVAYDPAAIEAMPYDGLTHRYLTADRQRTFRVDLPDGEYAVTLLTPAMAGRATTARVGAATLALGGDGSLAATTLITVQGGGLEVTIGDGGGWALAGLIVRRRAPVIGHLPLLAVDGDAGLRLTATATAPDGIAALVLRYEAGAGWREVELPGDGTAFATRLAPEELPGVELTYELEARDRAGRVTRRDGVRVPIVRGFRPPRITDLQLADRWPPGQPLAVQITVADGAFARELRLHYREVDQNREFRHLTQMGGRAGVYDFVLDTRLLDARYDLLVYGEVVDVFGGGSFFPDPFTDRRYLISRPA